MAERMGKIQKATSEHTSSAPWTQKQTSFPSAIGGRPSVIAGRSEYQRLDRSRIKLTPAITPGEAASKNQSPRKEKKENEEITISNETSTDEQPQCADDRKDRNFGCENLVLS